MSSNLNLSVVVTVLNEIETISRLVSSLIDQTITPKQIIIVDGGSNDGTWQKLQLLAEQHPVLMVKQQVGNRSVGRNLAILLAKTNLIAVTDAGCIPNNDWLAQLIAVQQEKNSDVVAGYYQGLAKTSFEQAVVPYALVMPGRVNPQTFLPATRSMLLKQTVWEELGGFNEQLSDNEDYAFAREIKNAGFSISFARDAIVNWIPPKTLSEFAKMIFRFARGDARAGIYRPKVGLIYFRFFMFIILVRWWAISTLPEWLIPTLLFLYFSWAIQKNKKYVKKGWMWLPVLQVVSDFAVMMGSVGGVF